MKKLYLIGGPMGVGKTSACGYLKQLLPKSVFLDGDWCWDAHPFQITEETKRMVLQNICFLLQQFIRCSAYQNIVFCWVMHEQAIIDHLIDELDTNACKVLKISLMTDETTLRDRLSSDVASGIRNVDVIGRSIERVRMYQTLDTIKVDTSNKTVHEIADEILTL